MITAPRERDLNDAADLLLDARRKCRPISDLPKLLQPVSLEEAYFVQDRMSLAYEDIGGWKVGAPSPDAEPTFAPMPKAWVSASGGEIRGVSHRFRGLEAEIAFCLGSDLSPRETLFSSEEVLAAISSMHPAIEIIETAFVDFTKATKFTALADMALHGGFIYGAAVPDWRKIDFSKESVTLSIDGAVRVERTGSNTAGDLLRLLPWLANHGVSRTEGLRKGDWITTGSWTGITQATAGSTAEAKFSTAGSVSLHFA